MNCTIVYGAKVRYFGDGQEMTEVQYRAATQAKDEARLAEMLAAGRPPQCVTDATFLRGKANGSQFAGNPRQGDFYKKVAESEGQNVKGKVYLSSIADHPGDARAWVSGRGDVARVCEERGWDCDGAVKVRGPRKDLDPAQRPEIADDIVNAEVASILQRVENPRQVDVQDLKEQVREKRKPKKK